MRGPHVTSFTVPASSSTPIALTGFGHKPEVLIAFYCGRAESVDTVGNASAIHGFGIAIAPNNQMCGFRRLADASPASSNVQSNLLQGYLVGAINGSGRLSLGSFDEDGATLIIPAQFSTAFRVTVLSLGKDQVTSKYLGLHTGTEVAGDVSLTGIGFTPKCGLFFGVGGTPSVTGHSTLHLGFASGENGSISQFGIAAHSRGNGASADCKRWLRRGYVIGVPNKAPNFDSLTDLASVSAWTSDGATLTYEIAAGFSGAYQFGFLALDGPGFDVGSFLLGEGETSGLDYVPLGGLMLAAGIQEGSDQYVCSIHDQLSIGAVALNLSALVQECRAVRSEDGSGNQNVTTAVDVDSSVIRLSASNTKAGEVKVSEMGNEGFKLQTVEQASLAIRVGYLAFGYPAQAITYNRIFSIPKVQSSALLGTGILDPQETLDFGIDWTLALKNNNKVLDDSIVESSWSVSSGTGVVIATIPPKYHSDTLSAVWLTGVTLNSTNVVTGRIVTAKSRIYERSFTINVLTQ